MKLADVDVYELVRALGMERSAWIEAASEEGRLTTEAEKITICVLAALQHALASAASASDPGDNTLAKLADAVGDKGDERGCQLSSTLIWTVPSIINDFDRVLANVA